MGELVEARDHERSELVSYVCEAVSPGDTSGRKHLAYVDAYSLEEAREMFSDGHYDHTIAPHPVELLSITTRKERNW